MKRGNKPYSVTFESLVMRLVKQLLSLDLLNLILILLIVDPTYCIAHLAHDIR